MMLEIARLVLKDGLGQEVSSTPLARLINEGQAVHVALLDAEGQVTHANKAFESALGCELVGRQWDSLLESASCRFFWEQLDAPDDGPVLVRLLNASGEPLSLSVYARRAPDGGVTVVGEPPWDAQCMMADKILRTNAELAVLSRENARQARLLEETNRKLNEAYWHLDKIAEVLPMCVSCRNVKTEEGNWEDVASFLMKHSDFLSHGYCEDCAERIIDESRRA
jgi:hypothetical protein